VKRNGSGFAQNRGIVGALVVSSKPSPAGFRSLARRGLQYNGSMSQVRTNLTMRQEAPAMELIVQRIGDRATLARHFVLSLLAFVTLAILGATIRAEELPRNPLDALRAYRYLQQICAIGPRVSGSTGMTQQQQLLEQHFKKFGGEVTLKKFEAKNPQGGDKVPMVNMIVRWHPERKDRILLCTHYDTRPLPDSDLNPVERKQGIFIGANDGGSGTAILMELAHLMPDLNSKYGVDFVLFDGEELVYDNDRDPYFLGSTWFAQQYVASPPANKYRWGVLLDMVGDAKLQIFEEQHSVIWPETRPLVNEIWATAGRIGVKEFVPRARYDIRDDHLPLRNIAKIPTCDIIDFDYPQWHTTGDTLEKCSGSSLAKVGWVIYEWLQAAQ
jgi:glutaminyl-peptide cyclotransferase